MPDAPPLTRDEIRSLLRECVTAVAPGETLIIRAYEWMTPEQVRAIQEFLDDAREYLGLEFRSLILPGAEFAVAAQSETAR